VLSSSVPHVLFRSHLPMSNPQSQSAADVEPAKILKVQNVSKIFRFKKLEPKKKKQFFSLSSYQ